MGIYCGLDLGICRVNLNTCLEPNICMVHGTEIYIVISGSIFELLQCIQPLRIAGTDLLLHCYGKE